MTGRKQAREAVRKFLTVFGGRWQELPDLSLTSTLWLVVSLCLRSSQDRLLQTLCELRKRDTTDGRTITAQERSAIGSEAELGDASHAPRLGSPGDRYSARTTDRSPCRPRSPIRFSAGTKRMPAKTTIWSRANRVLVCRLPPRSSRHLARRESVAGGTSAPMGPLFCLALPIHGLA
jgi:hypothetical protein